MPVSVNTASAAGLAAIEDVAPAALLIRPSGAVLIDSQKPFRFGTVPDQSLQECWDRISSSWPHPDVVERAQRIPTSDALGRSDQVAYRDPEIELVSAPRPTPTGRPVAESSIPSEPAVISGPIDLDGARRTVVDLALSRSYRLGLVRATGSGEPAATCASSATAAPAG